MNINSDGSPAQKVAQKASYLPDSTCYPYSQKLASIVVQNFRKVYCRCRSRDEAPESLLALLQLFPRFSSPPSRHQWVILPYRRIDHSFNFQVIFVLVSTTLQSHSSHRNQSFSLEPSPHRCHQVYTTCRLLEICFHSSNRSQKDLVFTLSLIFFLIRTPLVVRTTFP